MEDLNATNGFRTYKFGTPISSMPALKPDGEDRYIAPQEPLRIGNVELKSLYFVPYEGKLTTVVFTSVGEENCTKLLAMLKAQYGPGLDAGPEKTVWLGGVVTVFYEKQTSISDTVSSGIVNTPNCTVYLGSTALAAEKATKEGTKKAAKSTKKSTNRIR
jgi:hypothetical protein